MELIHLKTEKPGILTPKIRYFSKFVWENKLSDPHLEICTLLLYLSKLPWKWLQLQFHMDTQTNSQVFVWR